MFKKKERYATLVTDLDTHKPIGVIKGRNTEDVQAFLNSLPNLKYLSRDRAIVYRNLDKQLCHIADQFHVLMNASDVITKVIISNLPATIELSSEKTEKVVKGEKYKPRRLEGALLTKYNLIIAVKESYKKCGNYQQLCKEFNLSRHTVKRYCDLVNPKEQLLKRGKPRHTKWDEYRTDVVELLNQGYSVKVVFETLFSDKPEYKYPTFRHWCRELSFDGNRRTKTHKIECRNIANFLCGFDYNREKLLYDISKLDDCSVVTECAVLICRLKSGFNHRCIKEFKSIFEYEFTNKMLINFVKGLDSDYDAIKNSIVTDYNNSLQEGMVNKVKSIKKEMYGRCGFKLLETKILWWSIT